MRALVQRVSEASVRIGDATVGSCGHGLLVLLGIGPDDDETTARRLWEKIWHLRIFGDDQGKMNRSLADIDGEVLVVSQFTLYADCRRGHRPSFTGAASAELGERLYECFCASADHDCPHVGRGMFGADMQVSLTNDGPVTIWLDTAELAHGR